MLQRVIVIFDLKNKYLTIGRITSISGKISLNIGIEIDSILFSMHNANSCNRPLKIYSLISLTRVLS